MTHQHLIFILIAVAVAAAASTRGKKAGKNLHLIPHTHWEGAVFFTREEYLEAGLSHILTAVHLMKLYPEYRFALDQAAYVGPFLERYPEEAAAFRRFVVEGRMQLVGGMDVMPDDVKPGGELFVRQMQFGQAFFRREFGQGCTAAWLLDTFGHHPQMPQLLRQAGFDTFWFSRGVPTNQMPSEFEWQGVDGTRITSFWLPGFYGLFYGPPRDFEGFSRFFQDRFASLDPFAVGSERVGLAGADVTDAEQHVPDLVREFNSREDRPFTIRFSSPSEFASVVAKRRNLPVFECDLNPIFQGTYSSRIELHQATREIERKLLTAETLGVLCDLAGAPVKDRELWQAWEPLLFNQAHDTASGVMTDKVYEDTVQSYEFSKRLATEAIDERRASVVERIDTRGAGIPVVMFNPLGAARTDVAEVDLGFTEPGVKGVEVREPSGRSVPVQLAHPEWYEDGSLRRAKAWFPVREVPGAGYAVYRAAPVGTACSEPKEGGDTLENEFFRVRVDLRTGAILSVFDKEGEVEVLARPANVVARQPDHGDIWELYHALDGAMHLAATDVQPVPDSSIALMSDAFGNEPGKVVSGPVYSEFQVSHPYGTGSFSTRIRLSIGVPRIDVETEIVNREKHVRYQVLFPTAISGGKNVQEIPFGAVERPLGVEYPAQNWVDYGDGRRGVAVLNGGMSGNLVTDGTMMLSLLRSVDLIGYNEGRPSDSGFGLGIPRTFRYALMPHSGDWRSAEVWRHGQEFNAPLIVRKAPVHGGQMPPVFGVASVSQPNVVVSSLKPGPGRSAIVRVYEAAGRGVEAAQIRFGVPVASAMAVNLLEAGQRKLEVKDGAVVLDLRPFEIATVKVKFGA